MPGLQSNRSMARAWGALALVVALVVGGVAAAADDAREHNDRAEAAFALGRYGDAALEYEKAFELKPQPALLYDAAQAHRLAGHKQRALELYQNYLRVYGARVANRDEVEQHIKTLEAAIASEKAAQTAPPLAPLQVAPAPPPVATPQVAAEQHVAATQPVAPAPAPVEKPLIKRAWFWGVVAGVAVVAAVGITAGVLASSTSDPTPSLGAIQAGGQ